MDIETLKKLDASTIEKLASSLNESLTELKEILGEDRMNSESYVRFLEFSNVIDFIYMQNERKKLGIA